jgi:large subunit ribosomal protein L9
MKVILLRDVARLGKRYTVLEVPDGFALNKLIPQKMAEPATPENLKRVAAHAKEVSAHVERDIAAVKEIAASLATTPLVITAEANAQDHLFKSIRPHDVHLALAARGLTLLESQIVVETPIKSLGTHPVVLTSGKHRETVTVTINRS